MRRIDRLTLSFVLALAVPAWAQNTKSNNTADQKTPPLQGVTNIHATHGTKLMVHHALAMAIEGSALELTARQLAGNDAARLDKANAPASKDLQALQQDARQNFEDANKLMGDAFNLVQNDKDRAAPRRYYDAAVRYVKTLYGVIGEPLAKSADFRAKTDQGKDRNAGPALTANDVAEITLINHSVKEAISACQLRKLTTTGGPDSTAIEQLRTHAKQMSAHSERCVSKLNDDIGGKADTRDNAQAPASVALLARQARDLIQVLQDDRDNEGANRASERGR